MNLLTEALCDGRTGLASAKRIVLMVGVVAMSVCVVMLGIAAMLGHAVAGELGAVCLPLAGCCGYSYVGGKAQERRAEGAP